MTVAEQDLSNVPPTAETEFRVVIAGGGVGALEAILALHEYAPGVDVELISPESEFTLKALSVALPFSGGEPRSIDLDSFCREHGATFRADGVAEVWGESQRVLTDSGEEIFYDALLMATGARRYPVLPGAHPFRGGPDVAWFSEMLEQLERGEVRSLVFAVPARVKWSLPSTSWRC